MTVAARGQRCAGQTASALLPDTDHISGRIAEGRYSQGALPIRRNQDLAPLGDDLLQRFIDPFDNDIRQYARLSGNRQVSHEVSDHMPAAVLEAGNVAIGINAPAEHALVEDR